MAGKKNNSKKRRERIISLSPLFSPPSSFLRQSRTIYSSSSPSCFLLCFHLQQLQPRLWRRRHSSHISLTNSSHKTACKKNQTHWDCPFLANKLWQILSLTVCSETETLSNPELGFSPRERGEGGRRSSQVLSRRPHTHNIAYDNPVRGRSLSQRISTGLATYILKKYSKPIMFYVFGGFRGFFLFLFLFFLFGRLRRWTHDGWAGGRLGERRERMRRPRSFLKLPFFHEIYMGNRANGQKRTVWAGVEM